MKASNAILLNRAREKVRNSTVAAEEEETGLSIRIEDVDAEQRKYNSFWEGVQRRIAMNRLSLPEENTAFVKAQEMKKKKQDKTVIHPLNSYKVVWDLLVCFLVIYSIIMIPVRIGLNVKLSIGLVVFDGFIDCMFFLDMCLTFNTAYYDNSFETYIYSRKLIAQNYLKFWFWVDLISTVPIDDFAGLFFTGRVFSAVRAVRVLRLGRLFKLHRIYKLTDYLEETVGVSPSQLNLLLLMMQIFFVAHVFACFWCLLGQPSPDTNRTWRSEGGFEDVSLATQYIAALYFTIVTMLFVGYGDIHPTNPGERAFSIFMMLSGGVIFGALLSKVASLIERRNPQARAFKENMDEMRGFLEEYALPLHVKTKAKEAYSYYLKKKSSFGESGIFEDLPKPLLFKLVLQLYEKDIKKVQMFRTYDCSFVVELAINSKPFQAIRGEVLYNQGDVIKEIVFILSGMVRLSIESGSHKDVLAGYATEGTYFGDMEYLKNSVVTMAQYSAMNSCEFLSVSHQVMSQAIAENLSSGTAFKAEIERRLETFLRVVKSHSRGDLGRASVHRNRPLLRTPTPVPVLVAASPRGLFGVGPGVSKAVSTVAGAETIRSSAESTANGHASIWLNGQLRGQSESAHLIRLALRNSSDLRVTSMPESLVGTGMSGRPHRVHPAALTPDSSGDRPKTASEDPQQSVQSAVVKILPTTIDEDGSESEDSPDKPSEEDSMHEEKNIESTLARPRSPVKPPVSHRDRTGTGAAFHLTRNIEKEGVSSCRVVTTNADGALATADISHRSLHAMLLIDPKEPWKGKWDLFLAAIILYTIVMTPAEIAFYNDITFYSDELELLLDGIFFADLVLTLRTCLVSDVESALVVDQQEIALHCLKTSFTVDLLSCLPYRQMFHSVLGGNGLASVKILKSFNLIRLFKLGRILQLEVFISRLEDLMNMPRGVFELFQVLIEVFLICHLVACIWWGASDAFSPNPWFTKPELVYKDMSHAPVGEKYLVALYSTFTTMTTVGYGDIYASNTGEMILIIVLIVFGASVFGYILANVSTIAESFSRVESMQRNRISVIKEYLSEKGCPNELEKNVVDHFKHLFSITSAYQVDKIMSRLPASVRDDIMYYHNESKLCSIPIFKYIPNRSMALYIFKELTPVFFEKDQYIIREGVESTEINFLVLGSACAFTTIKVGSKPKIHRPSGAHIPKSKASATPTVPKPAFVENNNDDEVVAFREPEEVTHVVPRLSLQKKKKDTADLSESAQPTARSSSDSIAPVVHESATTFDSAFTLDPTAARASSSRSDLFTLGESMRIVGDFTPGNFFGHASLMKGIPNECSIVTTSPCTVFVLTKTVIHKLIHSEPIVGMKLQEALALAIRAQAQSLGQEHRRQNRADFLRDLKEKATDFHTGADPSLKKVVEPPVPQTRRRSVFSFNSTQKRDGSSSPKKQLSPDKAAQLRALTHIPKKTSMSQTLQSLRSPSKVGVQPDSSRPDVAARPSAIIIRGHLEAARKLRKLDSVLNEKTMFYNSDEEVSIRVTKDDANRTRNSREKPKQRLQRLLRRAMRQLKYEKAQKAARALKLAQQSSTKRGSHWKKLQLAVRNLEPPPESGTSSAIAGKSSGPPKAGARPALGRPGMGRQRSTFLVAVRNASLGLVAAAAAAPAAQVVMTRRLMIATKQKAEKNRRYSFSTVEGPYTSMGTGITRANVRNAPHKEEKKATRARRQSFPSLNNQAWKDALTYRGLL